MDVKKKKIIISVTNDLVADRRVNKVAHTLKNLGFEVVLVGRKLKTSLPAPLDFKTKRFKLLFRKKAFFYAEFNIRLFFYLIFRKADIFLSNDLDTLPANYTASKIKRTILVYDSHEYFTEVPELVNRKRVQKIWERIEHKILPKLKYSYTVCGSIAAIYKEKYGINMKVVRNIPHIHPNHEDFIPECIQRLNTDKLILYQGAVNIGRGLEQVIKAMKLISDAKFIIIGDGDIKTDLEKLVYELKLEEKVIFTGKIPFNQLFAYTKYADIGISLEENIGLNYYYALPNKLFDYIRAGIPVLASRLPEIEQIVNTFDIGCFIENHNPEHIAEKINYMLHSFEQRELWKNNLKIASAELSWENEEKVLLLLFNEIFEK